MKIFNTVSFKEKPSVWIDIILLLILISISYLKPIPFPWKVPTIAIIIIAYIYLYYRNLSIIGLDKLNWKNTLIWGVLIAVIIVVGISNLLIPVLERLLNKEVDYSAYGEIEGNTEFFLSYWWKAMFSAAIAEEIFYRGFTFYVLERIFKNFEYHKVLIVVLTAFYFGISHSFQGIVGVVGITAVAVILGSGYYLSKKNLYALIIAHALIDSWGLFSLYKGGISLFF